MTSALLGDYATSLQVLEHKGRLRSLEPRDGVDFTSNDFLGLARAFELRTAIAEAMARGVPIGAGGSRLLRGNDPEHEALEEEAAAFFGVEHVLYFASGYAANSALFATLPQRGDLIVHDALIHASAREGMLANKATIVAVRHNDADAFDQAIKQWRGDGGKGRPWIAVESLYSMDGDSAPLEALFDVACRHDGFLVIDEAHATGVLGPEGRGLTSSLHGKDNVISLHTCGKALGVSGALLALPAVLADYLINRARSFIYSTAPSPLMAVAVREALRIVARRPELRSALHQLVRHTGEAIRDRLGIAPSGSQIQPILIGNNARAVRIASDLKANGFDVRAIRPPTVPEGTARLRLSITLNVDRQQIEDMIGCLAHAIEEIRS